MHLTDTAQGTVVSVDVGSGFVDVVVLDNVDGLDVDDLTLYGFADRLELAGKVVENVTAPVYRRIGRAYRIGVNA